MRLLRPYDDIEHDEFPMPPMRQRTHSAEASVTAWIVVVFGAAVMALLIGWGVR